MYGAQPASAADIRQIESPGGIKAWLVVERSIPLISVRFAFAGGAVTDPPGKEGLAALMTNLLTEGAGQYDTDEFGLRLSEEGSELSVSAGRDRIIGGLDSLTKRFAASAELLRLALSRPRFDASAVERARKQHLSSLERAAKVPRNVAFDKWYATAFPNHPVGRPSDGTPDSVSSITRADIVAQHRRLLAKNSLKIVIVGDIGEADATKSLDLIFGELPDKVTVDLPDKPVMRQDPANIIVSMEQPLATAAFGFASLPFTHPNYPAFLILKQIVGSGDFDSVLMEEIRVKRGLAYAAQASIIHTNLTSVVLGGMSTKNENMGKALTVLREVLQRIVREGPTEAQFENAKRYLIGSYVLDFDTNRKLAALLLRIWLNGNGPDFLGQRNKLIERVTLDDVNRVAGNVLRLDRMIVVTVGKPLLSQ